MALTEVQSKGATVDNFTSTTLTFDSTPSVGSRLAVAVELWNGTGQAAGTGAITDNNSHTWTRHVTRTGDGVTGGCAIFSTVVTSVATTPVVITLNPGPDTSGWYGEWGILEIGGGASSLDVTSVDSGGEAGSATPTVDAVTPATTDWVVVGVLAHRTLASPITQPTGWTTMVNQPDNSAHIAGYAGHDTGNSTSSYQPQWSASASVVYRGAIAIFKADGGGGGGTLPNFLPLLGVG